MSDPHAAVASQLRNIQTKTGKTLAQWREVVERSSLTRHGEIRALLMERFALGYGDANALALAAKADADAPTAADLLQAIYAGPKAELRQLHDLIMQRLAGFGAFEIAPKKAYVSLRRKKQFAMVGPATKDQIEIGLNAKSLPADARLKAQPPGGMCQYTMRIARAADLDPKLMDCLRAAYDAAG